MTPVYSLTIPGKSTIEINQDELRSLLGQIETELHRSKVYRRALATVQKMVGDSAEQAKQLFKAVGREAIGLAFHQFAQQQQQVQEQPIVESVPEVAITEEKPNDLVECLTSAKFQPIAPLENVSDGVNLETPLPKADEKSLKVGSPLAWLKNKKSSKVEVAKLAAVEQRTESLRKIGQQLREARELRGLSLTQLNIYTHVPPHQMDAVERGSWEELPEEVFVRGFVRVMGNALGLNGTNLVASLPAPQPSKTVLPDWYKSTKNSRSPGFEISPIHLYVGYTALVAGAVGGLSLMSSQQANADKLINHNTETSSSAVNQSIKDKQPVNKPGLQSSIRGISVGSDIAPPEAF
jgi:cytoskeleton protein RodZ